MSHTFQPLRAGVLGGGMSGLLTALALKEWKPELEVVLIASSKVPVRGGAVATTPSFVSFLHGTLGIDAHRFERAVEPTIMLGTRFEWGLPAPHYFNQAFDDGDLVDAQAHDGTTLRYAMASQLMSADKAPFAKVGQRVVSLLKDMRFAWQLDRARLMRFLHQRASDVGVRRVDATVVDVVVHEGVVIRVRTDDGRELVPDLWPDLWVDGSGPRSLLLGEALQVPFESCADSLDVELMAVRDNRSQPRPYATVTTMQAGWCRTIPLRGEDHLGYLHSSRFLSDEAAAVELEQRFPGARCVERVRFESGRRRDFIAGNVVAIGAAYGTLEPLATTAIDMILLAISQLLRLLESGGQGAAEVNEVVGGHWDLQRRSLALHKSFNRHIDSPFWREGRVHDAAPDENAPHALDLMLLGQGVVPERLAPATTLAEWRELMSMREAVVACALPQSEVWRPLRDDPAILAAAVHDEGSWCRQMAADMGRAVPTRGRSQEALASWTREAGVPALLGRDAARLPDEFPTSPNIDFGKFIKKVPEVVLRPRDQAELADCLAMCVLRRLPIRIRGAGHSSGGQSLADEGAVIDLRGLGRIVADAPAEQRIHVEAGLWWLDLCTHLLRQGRRPTILTGNWRMTVGGTLAVGGFGDSTYREGLQVASVRELTVMTLDGTRHRVGPGDELFDWSLAGRGQLGIMSEVVLDTTTRGHELKGRLLEWPTLEHFLADARVIGSERRFEWLRARLGYAPGLPVTGVAGSLSENPAAGEEFAGLGAKQGPDRAFDLLALSAAEPDARWKLALPGVEFVLPVDATGIAAVHEITRRVAAAGLVPYLPNGSAIMALSGLSGQRFPMAPLPPADLVMLVAIRPEVPVAEAPRYLPLMRGIADQALAAGGKVYLVGLEPTSPGWFRQQLGPVLHDRLVALKAKWDPDGLLNSGLL